MMTDPFTVYAVTKSGFKKTKIDLSKVTAWGLVDGVEDIDPQRIEITFDDGEVMQIAMAHWFFRPIFDNHLKKRWSRYNERL